MSRHALANAPAERLRFALTHKDYSAVYEADLDAALAAERKATVERIRARVVALTQRTGNVVWAPALHSALDAEARREPLALARDALERLVRWAVDLPGQGTPPVTPDGWRNLRSIIERAGQALAALPEREVEG